MGEATWTPAPSAKSMATIQKWVAAYVGRPDDTEGLEQALAGIHMAIDRLNARTWNFTPAFEDIQFSALLIDYTLPANFKKPQRLMILDASGNQVFRLPYKTWQSFLNEHQDSTQRGEPCVYSCANVDTFGTLSLDVFPVASWVDKYPVGRMFYYRMVQYEGEDGEADWPSRFTPFIVEHARAYVADIYAPAKANGAYARAENYLQALIRDDNLAQTDWE